jgi:hypothetical protein
MINSYLTSMSDTEYVVRVDHVSDIMFIPFFDEMVPSAFCPLSAQPSWQRSFSFSIWSEIASFSSSSTMAITLTSMSDTEYVVRVDHVSDFMFIPFFDEMVPSAWRVLLGLYHSVAE